MNKSWAEALASLNPYSNGMWIELMKKKIRKLLFLSLNPYSNGMWIEQMTMITLQQELVLILILMECG